MINGVSFRMVDTSYSSDDVIILLKDVSGSIQAQDTSEREKQFRAELIIVRCFLWNISPLNST